MGSNYLLPHKYKIFGWVLSIIGICVGFFLLLNQYESEFFSLKVLAIYSDPLFGKVNFFKIIENSIFDELAIIIIVIGGLIIGFSKEKVEDEYIYKLRTESLVWALIINYIILIFFTIFIYGMSYFHILIFNMFTPLLFFIIRFNFLKLKSRSHEE